MTTTQIASDLADLARAAGREGRGWDDWTRDDVVQDFILRHSGPDHEIHAWEVAHREGLAEYRAASGWISHWTTAPDEYDSFGTITVEHCGTWHDRALRRVLVDPSHLSYQIQRFRSGVHGSWDCDPREEEREAHERRERWRREDAERAARREAGLRWLTGASEIEVEAAINADEVESRGLTYSELRGELVRRANDALQAARADEWARCSAAVPMGAILVDDGAPAQRGRWGVIPGRPPRVFYAVRIQAGTDWQRLADHAIVESSVDREVVGSLAVVAARLADGSLRIAAVDAVPPEPVVRRFGHERYREIHRVVIGDRVVWAGRPWASSAEVLVLDERGHLVRAARVRAAALQSYESR